jgi:hypothetical protein
MQSLTLYTNIVEETATCYSTVVMVTVIGNPTHPVTSGAGQDTAACRQFNLKFAAALWELIRLRCRRARSWSLWSAAVAAAPALCQCATVPGIASLPCCQCSAAGPCRHWQPESQSLSGSGPGQAGNATALLWLVTPGSGTGNLVTPSGPLPLPANFLT